jgi:lipooligosaccharide transport system permease protein
MSALTGPTPYADNPTPPGFPDNPTPPQTSVLAGAGRLFDYWAIAYKRTWKGSAISSFVNPLLYVLAMGVLLGGFIKADPARLEGATSYLAFVAPGMVAAQAMQTVFGEVTYPVMGAIKWHKSYYGMIATPLGVPEIVLANLGFVLFRVALTCAVFFAVLAPFDVFESLPGVLIAFLVQLLLGAAFAAPLYGYSAGLKDESGFSLVFRLGMIPLFLFSGAFFPITNLSAPLEALARITPLWHGVDLTRMLVLDNVDWSMAAIHVVYLGVLAVVGWFWAVRRLTRRMIT